MKVVQLTASNIVKDVLEGNNLNKVFQKYSKENKINPKDLSQIKESSLWYASVIWENKICY